MSDLTWRGSSSCDWFSFRAPEARETSPPVSSQQPLLGSSARRRKGNPNRTLCLQALGPIMAAHVPVLGMFRTVLVRGQVEATGYQTSFSPVVYSPKKRSPSLNQRRRRRLLLRFAGDTCVALDEFRRDTGNSSLGTTLIPCDRQRAAKSAMRESRARIHDFINKVSGPLSFCCQKNWPLFSVFHGQRASEEDALTDTRRLTQIYRGETGRRRRLCLPRGLSSATHSRRRRSTATVRRSAPQARSGRKTFLR